MAFPKGYDLGGIRTLEDLKARCRIDEDTECWHWTMSCVDNSPRVHYWAPDGSGRRHDKGRRAAVFLATGKPVKTGHISWQKACCPSRDCVNPDHVQTGTKAAWGKWLSKTGMVKNLASKSAGARRAWDKRGRKITPEMAHMIMHSEESAVKLAEKLGLSQYAIWSVRSRTTHVETMPNSSVFAWRP